MKRKHTNKIDRTSILRRWRADEEVIWLDIAVNERLVVYTLNTRNLGTVWALKAVQFN